jgi:hypothetical protein
LIAFCGLHPDAQFGRSVPAPEVAVRATFRPSLTLKGAPEEMAVWLVICQNGR